jgi:DNA ligase 1
MPWDVQYRDGVWLPQIGWWLDAHHPVDRSFVSHAHFDHLAPHREVLCSEGTCRLMHDRMPETRIEHVLPFGQTEQLTPETRVTLYPAGHIFGSAQALLEHAQHGRLLYTGDFKLRPGLSAERCATPRADVLIMETTFGRPHYVFPPTPEVLRAILHFCQAALEEGETPVLFGYSLGKSQEVLSSLAEAHLPVMLHSQSLRITRIYEELGLTFPPYRPFAPDELSGHVVICPPQAANSAFLKMIKHRRTAVLTGWAMDAGAQYRYQCDAAFPLSDHADYHDLLRYVELVEPKQVLTLHGFASDFARTLRDRGIEAWAISQDNQLEMALAISSGASAVPTIDTAENQPTLEAPTANAFAKFAATAEAVKATPKKLEKIAILSGYLSSLDPDDAARAALYLTGRSFAQSSDQRLNLGWSAMYRAVLAVTGANEASWRAAYRRFADSGDAAELLLQRARTGRPIGSSDVATPGPDLRASATNSHGTAATLAEIEMFLAAAAAARGPVPKIELLERQLRRLTPSEAKYLLKIMSGDLRIGLKEGLVEEAIAASTDQPVTSVREANMLCGDITTVVRAARAATLDTITLRVFNPLQFMLASPEPTAEALLERLGAPLWLEEKYDGIRCQLHRQDGRAELYSRDLHRITDQFPDLAREALALPADCIIDGELLAWREGRAMPFAELQKRLGRRGDDFFLGAEIPVSLSAYDLLWLDGRSLLKEPLRERRRLLEQLIKGHSFHLAPVQQVATVVDIEAAFLRARQRGNEGLMAKDPISPYTPGRRGLAWLKLKKAYATLDVVVVAVEYGHGKRRGVLSDYTFAVRDEATDRLLTVGKAYSGLTDAEIASLTQHFLEHTIEDHGRYRVVEPDTVLEIAFDSIQPSKRHNSGFALRFPRIARIRTDKTPAEIDTLETCRRLAAAGGTLVDTDAPASR